MQAADSVSRPNGKVGVSTLNKEVFFLKSQFNYKKLLREEGSDDYHRSTLSQYIQSILKLNSKTDFP